MSSASSFDRSAALIRVVSRTRAGLVATVLAAGFCLAVAAALGWVVGGIVLDLAAPLPVGGRVIVFAGWWSCVIAAVIAFLLVPAIRRPSLDTVAILIEQTLGGMHNRLLTVMDVVRGRRSDPVDKTVDSRGMFERLVTQTAGRLDGYRSGRVIKGRALARNVALVIVAAAALVWMAIFLGNRFSITLSRLINPTADIPPATWLQLTSPGPLEVLEGESFEIGCDVARGEVANVSLVLTPVDGLPIKYPLRTIATGRFALTLDGLDASSTYRLEGGNTWTKTYPIMVLRRPVIEEVATSIRLPSYMRIDEPLAVAADAVKVEAPYESNVDFCATLSGDVVDGGVKLLERSVEQRIVERVDEQIWFEDDLPRDAVSPDIWRWTTASAAGGLRAFMLDGGVPMAMKTRLNPLLLPKDSLDSKAIFVHVKPDATDPPRALAIEWEAGDRRIEVVWGDASVIPEVGVKRIVAGPLPSSNEWTRLEMPLAGAVREIAGRAVEGLSLRLDRGRLLVDRPGWLVRGSQSIEEPIDTLVGTIAAIHLEDGCWLTSVRVDAPRLAAIEFHSSQGYPSLPRPAVEIVPTVDRPPSLIVHEPPDTLTLESPVDVSVAADVFDDWGLDEIGIQSGPDAEHLGPRIPLAGLELADRPPEVRRDLRHVIRSDVIGLAAGKTVAWRLYVRDTKGQITDGPVRKITVTRPPEHALADSQVPAAREASREARRAVEQAKQRKPSLEEQRQEVLKAVGENPLAQIEEAQAAADVAEQAERMAAQQPPDGNDETKQAAEKARDEAQQQAATKVENAQAAIDQSVAAFQDPAKQSLSAAETSLEAQRADAARLAEAITKAAEQAKNSPLVPEPQAEALAELAERAAQLEESLQKDETFVGEAAKVERIASAPTSDEVAREAEAIGEAVEQIVEAIDAVGAIQRLTTLTEDLSNRAASLESLASDAGKIAEAMTEDTAMPAAKPLGEEVTETAQQASDAAAEQTVESSALAESTRQELGELERILGTEPTASGETSLESVGENASYDVPTTGQPTGEAVLPIDGNEPAFGEAPGEVSAGTMTGDPEAFQPMLDSLAAGVGDARQAAAMVAELAAELAEQAAAAAQSQSDEEASLAAAALAETLTGEPVQSALAMAERARALAAMRAAAELAAANQQPGQGEQPGHPGEEPGEQSGQQAGMEEPQGPAGRGPNDSDQPRTTPVGIADADRRGLDPAMRAAIEKLPPHVREPLLEGMRQQGPEAYRKVIEAYFKRLGKEIPR